MAKLLADLERFDGILVPGGFGKRGIEGMLTRSGMLASPRHHISELALGCRPW
jgi:CTP synthase (UTP-ammonia lyase)